VGVVRWPEETKSAQITSKEKALSGTVQGEPTGTLRPKIQDLLDRRSIGNSGKVDGPKALIQRHDKKSEMGKKTNCNGD